VRNAGGADSNAAPKVRREEVAPAKDASGTWHQRHPPPRRVNSGICPGTHASVRDSSRCYLWHRYRPSKPTPKEPAGGQQLEPAYTTVARSTNPCIAKTVYERTMESPIPSHIGGCSHCLPKCAHSSRTSPRGSAWAVTSSNVMVEDVPDPEGDNFLKTFKSASGKGSTRGAYARAAA